jgi:hypothetical protein
MERPPMKTIQLWSLYGYVLTLYVVDTSLGVPTRGADFIGAQSIWLEIRGFRCRQHP